MLRQRVGHPDIEMTAPPVDHDRIFATWQTWTRRVVHEIGSIRFHEIVWTQVRDEIVERYPDGDGTFLAHYSRLYADAQLMAIRRVAEDTDGRGTDSLAHLLRAMQANPKVMTRDRWIALEPMFPAGSREIDVGSTYDERYGDANGHVRPDLIARDLDRVEHVVTAVKRRADTAIAHLDRVDAPAALTYADLRATIADVTAIAEPWVYLLLGAIKGQWVPVITTDWQQPLRDGLFLPP